MIWLLLLLHRYFTINIQNIEFNRGEFCLKYYLSKGESDKCLAILITYFSILQNDECQEIHWSKWYILFVDPTNGAKSIMKPWASFRATTSKLIKDHQFNCTKWTWFSIAFPRRKLRTQKYILVDFWYSSCPPCIAEVPKLNELYSVLKDRGDINFHFN